MREVAPLWAGYSFGQAEAFTRECAGADMVAQTMKDVIGLRTECYDHRRTVSMQVRSSTAAQLPA